MVELEFEKLDLPDNAVAEIFAFHGGVYGMLPREVWDESCMPQSMPHETNNHITMLSTEFNDHMSLINHLIRKDNWGMDSSYE